MDKTFLAIVGSVIIAWTLLTFDAQAGYWISSLNYNCPPNWICCYF